MELGEQRRTSWTNLFCSTADAGLRVSYEPRDHESHPAGESTDRDLP
jgi:hypothetical protein